MKLDEARVDDTFDDAKAAYAEVAGRAAPEAEAPVVTKDAAETAEPSDKGKPEVRRAPDGKFAPRKDAKAEPEKAVETVTDKQPEKAAQEEPAKAEEKTEKEPEAKPVVGGPPPSWGIQAKARWEALPDTVRAEIVKREGEVAQGLAALRDYRDLKPYAEMAAKNGTTIAKALERYVNFESVLKQNVAQGLAIIAQNYGYTPEKAAELFAQMAEHYSGGKIKVGGAPAAQAAPADPIAEVINPVLNPILTPLQKELQDLRALVSSQVKASEDAKRLSFQEAVQKFASDPANRFFPDLEEQITQLFEKGIVQTTGNYESDLRRAYDLAARMNPEVSEALIEQRLEAERKALRKKEQEEAEKAKAASRSITGSRVPGTVVKDRAETGNSHDDIEDDVRRAYRLHAQV